MKCPVGCAADGGLRGWRRRRLYGEADGGYAVNQTAVTWRSRLWGGLPEDDDQADEVARKVEKGVVRVCVDREGHAVRHRRLQEAVAQGQLHTGSVTHGSIAHSPATCGPVTQHGDQLARAMPPRKHRCSGLRRDAMATTTSGTRTPKKHLERAVGEDIVIDGVLEREEAVLVVLKR